MLPSDALMVKDAGADAIGLNFADGSPRCLSLSDAETIVRSVREHEAKLDRGGDSKKLEWVGVFVNASASQVRQYSEALQLDWVQLHGDESAEFRRSLGRPAYHAARIADEEDFLSALKLGSQRLLVDAKVDGAYGGTGEKFDWSLLEGRPAELELVLAGGLKPENIAQAVEAVRPYGVDTASGVESAPGRKDFKKVHEFVRLARQAERP